MLELARARAEHESAPPAFIVADAQTHAFEPGSFDTIVSRFGVMFFDDPVRAFANLHGAAKPGARLVLIAWRSAAENPFMTSAERVAAPFLPDLPARRPHEPGQFAFGDPDRDPRGHVISVAYFALIASEKLSIVAGADAAEAAWFRTGKLPHLAFDHRQIFDYALQRLRSKLEYSTVGFQLLPKKFTLSELQSVYEAILEKRMDKRNFRRKIALLGIVKPIKEWRHTGRKPAQLFRFSAVQAERKKSD